PPPAVQPGPPDRRVFRRRGTNAPADRANAATRNHVRGRSPAPHTRRMAVDRLATPRKAPPDRTGPARPILVESPVARPAPRALPQRTPPRLRQLLPRAPGIRGRGSASTRWAESRGRQSQESLD